ncbi:MAG: tetratricopeptide repeat protein [Candidatus Thiodiazotropha sp.]|jgi:Flp pilus assembly protein TadD
MPKLSPLAWFVLLIGQATFGLIVYVIAMSHCEQCPNKVSSAGVETTIAAPMPAMPPQSAAPAQSAMPGTDSDDPALIARLADDYFAKKDYTQAIGLYERVIRIKPDDVESYNDLGLALFYTGEATRALEILKAGILQDPTFQRIHLTLGFVLGQTGDKAGATEAFNRAIDLGADNKVGQEAVRMRDAL